MTKGWQQTTELAKKLKTTKKQMPTRLTDKISSSFIGIFNTSCKMFAFSSASVVCGEGLNLTFARINFTLSMIQITFNCTRRPHLLKILSEKEQFPPFLSIFDTCPKVILTSYNFSDITFSNPKVFKSRQALQCIMETVEKYCKKI